MAVSLLTRPSVPVAHPPTTVWAPRLHILELDGVRGLAILIVTINRFMKYVPAETQTGALLHQAVVFGERGVDLFFVLSGFLITGVLLDSRDQPNYFRNFFARRTLRIFPLYFVSLLIFVVALPATGLTGGAFEAARQQQIYLWTYLANVRIAMEQNWCLGPLDHFWSLAVEEHFYLLWPFAVFVMVRARFLSTVLWAAAACGIARIAFSALSDNGVAPDVMSGFRFDGLLLGAAVAHLARTSHGLAPYRSLAIRTAVATGSLAIMLELFTDRLLTISHSVWAILWASVLVALLTSQTASGSARFFRSGWLRSLGRYSYAMYVFQSPLIPLLAGVWSAAGISIALGLDPYAAVTPTIIYAAGMFALTYLVARISWIILEKRCLKLKRFF
jgi:peptidoglycan/LPS O-acetylase OafA/YrhL